MRIATDHAATIGGQVGGRSPRMRSREIRITAKDIRLPRRVRFARGQHNVARTSDRVIQRVVICRIARLSELDVINDRPRAIRAQPVDRLRIQPARKRPLQIQVIERLVIDTDDHNIIRTSSRPQPKPNIDRAVLKAPQHPGQHQTETDHRRDDRHNKHRQHTARRSTQYRHPQQIEPPEAQR